MERAGAGIVPRGAAHQIGAIKKVWTGKYLR